jgi:hypothetical protein
VRGFLLAESTRSESGIKITIESEPSGFVGGGHDDDDNDDDES